MKTVLTHTGKIYVDTEHRLEFLTVGDYGKENNIKADFLGLTKEINGVENTAVDLSKKWVAQISRLADELPMPVGRKYTLNFPVTSQTILDAKELSKLFDREKFIVKITPIHETASAIENGFQVTGYSDYDVYRRFEQLLLKEGWDVIVFVPSKEEDSDRITCGNALISEEKI